MRRLAFWASAWMSVLGATACGEVVDFDAGLGDAASTQATSDATVASTDGAADAMSFFGPPDGSGFVFDGHIIPHRDASLTCVQCTINGGACRVPSDCCYSRCEEGVCLPPTICSAPNQPCTASDLCCSDRCEPFGPNGATTCTPYCVADLGSCQKAADCCSLACNFGVCGTGPICSSVGSTCQFNSDCCENECVAGHCVSGPGSCLPTGEDCGDAGGTNCCSGACNPFTNRCDAGNVGCRAKSTPCILGFGQNGGQCCLGSCMPNAKIGVAVCTPVSCLNDGDLCNLPSDCCTGTCSGSPPRCGGVCEP
jgi:hypothetical protein